MKKTFVIFLLAALVGCVGTDYEDDPKDPAIVTNVDQLSLVVGDDFQIEATYHYNMWKPEPDKVLSWISKDASIASVDQYGLVSASSKGQTAIEISYMGEETALVLVTVVETNDDVAKIIVTAPQTSIGVGETMQLTAQAFTLFDDPVNDVSFTWSSSDASIATIDEAGLVTGIADGTVKMFASGDGVTSYGATIMVGISGRVGVFQSSGSYKAIGTATLESDQGNLILKFSDDFETSFALGTFVYLANSTSGTAVRSQGLEIAEVTTNGAKTYNITDVDASVTLDTYQYVILLCKPASITFGYAELK